MNEQEENKLGQAVFKLNVSQVLQGVMIAGIIGIFVQFQDLKDTASVSLSERKALKEDIEELKNEVRFLRNIIYSSMRESKLADSEE